MVAGSTRVSTQADDEIILSDEEEEDEEALLGQFHENDEHVYYYNPRGNAAPSDEGRSPPEDDFVNQLEWDEDLISSDSMITATSSSTEQPPPSSPEVPESLPAMKRVPVPTPPKVPRKPALKQLPGTSASLGVRWDTPPSSRHGMPASLGVRWDIPPSPQMRETTPLLGRNVSFSPKQAPRRISMSKHGQRAHHIDLSVPCPTVQRRASNASLAKSVRSIRSIRHVGQSTFGQTVCCF